MTSRCGSLRPSIYVYADVRNIDDVIAIKGRDVFVQVGAGGRVCARGVGASKGAGVGCKVTILSCDAWMQQTCSKAHIAAYIGKEKKRKRKKEMRTGERKERDAKRSVRRMSVLPSTPAPLSVLVSVQ